MKSKLTKQDKHYLGAIKQHEFGHYHSKAVMKAGQSFKIASGENRQFRIQMTREMAKLEYQLNDMKQMPSRAIVYELGLRTLRDMALENRRKK